MKKYLIPFLAALMSCQIAGAQLLPESAHIRRNHHTHRLPGVNEHRLERLEKMRQANIALRHRQGPWRAQTEAQTKKGLVLLVQFSDTKMKSGAAEQWNNRFNQQGFSLDKHVGSVSDFFFEQSYGLLSIDFDVIGPLTLSNTRKYYGTAPNNNLDDRAAEMVIEALTQADSQVNYADYDWDGDGYVDQVYVIFAGITSSTESGYIWPHEWQLSSARYYGSGSGRQRKDGVYIDTYAVSNELATSTMLEGIGTACHEFSHCLGYPDFYDTGYNGGTAAQNWDVLDAGSYNGPKLCGEVPSPYTAYERWTAGWIDLIPLTSPVKVTDMPAINNEGVAYVITNTGNTNEYYILENRQQVTFGTYNRGHGLMVWHIDYNKTAWDNNEVNTTKSHQRMTFLPADGSVGTLTQTDYGSYYDISANDEAGDPFPGYKKVTSVPALTWFISEKGGTKTHGNLIHDISESKDGKITFIYGDVVLLDTPEVLDPTNVGNDTFTANWLPVDGATSYTLQVEAQSNLEAPMTILVEDFSNFNSIGEGNAVSNSVVDKYTQESGWSASGLYGTGSSAVRISSNQVNGYLTTPALTNKAGKLTVEFDAAYYNNDGSSVVVSVLNGSQTISSQTISLTSSSQTYSCTFDGVPTGCKVKFGSTAKKKRFYLYNVKIMDMSGVASDITTYEGLTSTHFAVTDIDAEVYFYRIRAVNEEGTSDWTEWQSIDLALGLCGRPSNVEQQGEIYDLTGRRLQQVPARGIYIRDGKVRLSR